MLDIKNLFAGYGKLTVLKEVSLRVKPGEIVALIGPNGAGKSTVIKSVFNLCNVTKGKILFKDTLLNNLPTHELISLGISYVNQGRICFSSLTVYENLVLSATGERDLIEKNLKKVFRLFPALKDKQKKLAYSLSGGQRQQLALGRSLMQNPSLLLLDEPSLGLSPILQKELFLTLEKLREEGIALLIVEQNAKKAIEIADKTYVLEDGKIVLKGGRGILKNKKIKEVYLGGRY